MAYRIMAFDLDGTLTNSKKKITAKTKEALLRANKMGVMTVLASGRPLEGILPLVKELEMDKNGGYILAFNGGQILDAKTMEVLSAKMIPAEILPELFTKVEGYRKEYGTAMLTYGKGQVLAEDEKAKYVVVEANINGMTIRETDLKTEVDFPVPKCILTGEGEILEPIEKELKAQYDGILSITRSESYFLEMMTVGVDKADSLDRLLKILGMTKDELIAFGDGYNDISMIKYAGLGICMANGKDETKAAADYVTLSNDEEGIPAALEKFLFNA